MLIFYFIINCVSNPRINRLSLCEQSIMRLPYCSCVATSYNSSNCYIVNTLLTSSYKSSNTTFLLANLPIKKTLQFNRMFLGMLLTD